MDSQAERGLLGLVALGSEASEQVDEEIERTAVAGVLNQFGLMGSGIPHHNPAGDISLIPN